MCDTLVALPKATAGGATLFAKNSDRERNEAQGLEITAAADHPAGAAVQLTYIAITQVRHTHACLLSRPFWMWGAEMGANEYGVVIGNEAVHSIIAAGRKRALTGMDLVRLGLERAATASEAVDLIVGLLERHGQGGDCGHLHRFYYHNSFIIADRTEAFVLETVGRWWALERVAGARALSNALSIGPGYAAVSRLAEPHARDQGWIGDDGRFDFAARLFDPGRDAISRGRERRARGQTLMDRRLGALTPRAMMAILRDHGAAAEGQAAWTPADQVGRAICMHAAQGARRSQTTGSLVAELREGRAVFWVTGTAAPCLGIFKPVLIDVALPTMGPAPTDHFDAGALWWRHECLHRAALRDFSTAVAVVTPSRDALEASFAERIDQALAADPGPEALQDLVEACWREARAAEAEWMAAIARVDAPPVQAGFQRSWNRLNHIAGMGAAPHPDRRAS